MACRFLCGFDDYDITGAAYEWQLVNTPAVTSGLTGSCLYLAYGSSSALIKCARVTPFPEGKASFFCGFRFLTTAFPTTTWGIFSAGDATMTHVMLGLSSTGNLVAYRSSRSSAILEAPSTTTGTVLATGSAVLLPNVPIYIEVEITIADSGGVFKVYVNGSATPDINVSSGDTQNTGTAYATWIEFSGQHLINSGHYYVDDVYANDTTGSKNTGLEGDVQVRSHMPNANGNSSQWDRSTGADQYATIDENPQSTTDYNSTSTLNEVDTVNIESLADAGATIKAVQVNILAKKTTSGTGGIVPVMRVDSVDYPHATTQYISTDWAYIRQTYDQQADATDWNETDFNATECGYKKTA